MSTNALGPSSSYCTFTSYYNRPPPPPAQDLGPSISERSGQPQGASLPALYRYDLCIVNQTTPQFFDYLDPNLHYFSTPLPGALGQDLVKATKKECNVSDPFPFNLTYTPLLDANAPGQPNIPADTMLSFFMEFFLPQSADTTCVERAIASSENQGVKCVANVTSEIPVR